MARGVRDNVRCGGDGIETNDEAAGDRHDTS
jgi:hypothetical protein